jgi:hypothetical protein
MKPLHRPAALPRPRPLAAALLLPALATFVLSAVAAPAAKDHILFVGTDLAVGEDGAFYPVVGATKDTLKIDKDHRMEEVRTGKGANIRINRGVKLSSLSATIADVKMESVDRAAARAQLAAMQSMIMLQQESDDQADRLHGRMTLLSAVAVYRGPGATRGSEISDANVKENYQAATATYTNALPTLDQSTAAASTLLNQTIAQTAPIDDEVTLDASALPGLRLLGGSDVGGSGPGGSPGGAGPGSSTASSFIQHNTPTSSTEVELTFKVSSPTPLDHAYLVVVANYASLNDPSQVARQISTREFAHLDSHPQRVKMTHAASLNGLPFKKFDLGLYANGQEVATNLSEKRMPLTTDQAYQFFLIDYLSSHQGATLPPAPILMTPRTEFRQQVKNVNANQTIYATVDKTGDVRALSTDAAGIRKLPASMDAILQNVRFMPALNNGSPVDGRVKVTLAQLAN